MRSIHRTNMATFFASALLLSTPAAHADLTVNGTTVQLGGIHYHDKVEVINGGRIEVIPFDGSDKVNTGNLQLVAKQIIVDATSSIVADGAGYQPALCDHGAGPTASAGGRGGCAVLDSGGGGAHFGNGGRGTKDCFCVSPNDSCQFDQEFEEDCGYKNPTQNQCISTGGAPVGTCPAISGSCYNNDGLPSVAGQAFPHSIYQAEFGAAGGDKGCRDGWDNCSVGGAGGGRIVLAAVDQTLLTGSLEIHGRVSAEGWRGCGRGNDSGGGGAGGSLLLVGDTVLISNSAYVSAAGGLGGDTNAKQPGSTCPTCAQNPGGTCDDCGGGGGGGIISVLSRQAADIDSTSVFNVKGAEGGTCTICKGEAGGGAGELQLSGVYGGEFCDGYDNDFDGKVDEDLGDVSCGTGACLSTVAVCNTTDPNNVFPNSCVPSVDLSCLSPLDDTRSRFMVIVDTSGSMLTDLNGNYTFGDGSTGHTGLDTNGDSTAGNDSRLFKAKKSLTEVISAYPEIDFGVARFAQGVGQDVNCQLAHWFECAGLCCTYDDPTNNTGVNPEGPCQVTAGAAGALNVLPTSAGEECINYAGSCGTVRRGSDILVGFTKPLGQKLMWLDNQETAFQATTTPGDHCNYGGGGDCELRGTGPTPLADSLYSVLDYLGEITPLDPINSCRQYAVILLTDGTETCRGNPPTAAAEILSTLGIETYVIGFSVLSSEQAALDQIANAGSLTGTRPAFFVGNEDQLTATLASIVASSVRFEKCNDLDDDCDLLVDEDFPLKGQPCNNGRLGVCFRTGQYICNSDGSGVVCNAENGGTGSEEVCNGLDDNCNGQIDENLPNCIPPICQPEVCNNKDDDCDGIVDNNIPSVPCGNDVGRCTPGMTKCEQGVLSCDGGEGPFEEVCNGEDDNCDGTRDGMSEPCYSFEQGCDLVTGVCQGTCHLGARLCAAIQSGDTWQGVWGECLGDRGPDLEICDGLDNNCDGVADENASCPNGAKCIEGSCTQPCTAGEFGCPVGFLCDSGWCIPDPCDPLHCEKEHPGWVCYAGECIDACKDIQCAADEVCYKGVCRDNSCYARGCPPTERCIQKICKPDPCATVSCTKEEYCVNGQCVQLCEAIFCPEGETCKLVDENGQKQSKCIEDLCFGISCAAGKVCENGQCYKDECLGTQCPRGQICHEGTCIANPCELTTCPPGRSCILGECRLESVEQTTELLATGGGGLSCTVGTRPEEGGLFLLITLFFGLGLRQRWSRCRGRN